MKNSQLGMDVPPLDQLGADVKGLDGILRKIGEFAGEERQIDHRLQNFDAEIEEARDEDARRLAESLKGGKEPGGAQDGGIRQKEAEREGLERRQKAISLVVEDLVGEARRYISEHAPEWARQSEGAVGAAAERYSRAVEELAASRGDFYAAWSTAQWLEDRGRKYRPRAGDAPVKLNLERGASPMGAPEVMIAPVLDAMRHEAGGPERRKAEAARPKVIMHHGHPQAPAQEAG